MSRFRVIGFAVGSSFLVFAILLAVGSPAQMSGFVAKPLLQSTLEGDENVDGRQPRRVSAGEAWHNPRGAIHELRNVGDTPVRVVNTLVVDKGKPRMQPAPQQ